jgi:hypothetical protein
MGLIAWITDLFTPKPDPTLVAFEIALKHGLNETGRRIDTEAELEDWREVALAIFDKLRVYSSVSAKWPVIRPSAEIDERFQEAVVLLDRLLESEKEVDEVTEGD